MNSGVRTGSWEDLPWSRSRSVVAEGPLAGRSYPVWSHRTGGPPVVVLHELLGPSPATLDLAAWLAARDPAFSVHVPALFGKHGQRSMTGLLRSKICIRREFVLFRTGRTSPIVTWLRQLVGEVSELHGGSKVGVVGMCLTGGFALGLIAEPSVAVAVASQPSLPMAPLRGPMVAEDLGLSPDEVPPIDQGRVHVLQYTDDRLCPRARGEAVAGGVTGDFETLPNEDPTAAAVSVAPSARGKLLRVNGSRHAVLTADLSPLARERLAEWLADEL